jgi:MoxR-like ATPase
MQALIIASKTAALIEGRYNVSFGDIQQAALPALRHRVLLNYEAQAENKRADDVIREIVAAVKPE